MRIDVTLVSGRRPELLRRMLASFQTRLFPNFRIERFIVNIDPFGGAEADHSDCVQLIRAYFPRAEIIEPETASFGAAVKSLWSRTSAEWVLHLEDDWLVERDIGSGEIASFFLNTVKAVQFYSKEMQWDGTSLLHQRRKRRRFLGIPIGRTTLNIFGTSPGVWSGDIARRAAALLDPSLDPEKQMRPPFNPPLFDFLNNYSCAIMSDDGKPVIRDIGREWREAKGIYKSVREGRSIWTSSAAPSQAARQHDESHQRLI